MRIFIIALVMFILPFVVIGQSDDIIILEFSKMDKMDLKTERVETFDLSTSVIYKDTYITILFNDTTLKYKIINNTFEISETKKGNEYVSYKVVLLVTGDISTIYHSGESIIVEEGDFVFRFYDE